MRKINIMIFCACALMCCTEASQSQKTKVNTKDSAAKQIEALEKEKQSRTPVERKIDSQLLQAIKEKNGEKMAPGVDLEPANVNADASGNLEVDISADVTDSLLNNIKKLGGKIIYPSKEYHTIRARINLSVIKTIAAYTSVKFIAPAAQPHNDSITKPGNNQLKPVQD